MSITLDPRNPASWTEHPLPELFALDRADVEEAQRTAIVHRFTQLRPGVRSLDKLADKQGVTTVESFEDVLPILFDHRVYKAYPLSLIERRKFERLTGWLDKLTTHDLTAIPLDGLNSVDAWLDRLDEHGMIVGHSTGTTGKLSFIPRSQAEWPAWKNAQFNSLVAATGRDPRVEHIQNLSASGHRTGHQMMTKMGKLFAQASVGGDTGRTLLHDYAQSSDLLSLAGRLQAAEESGELDTLKIDSRLLEERQALIENSRHRDEDMVRWFEKAVADNRGQRVQVGGTAGELVRLALAGQDKGIVTDFAVGSTIMTGGGFKGYQGAPEDWQDLLKSFFGIDRICSMYGMSECMGTAPKCSAECYHLPPYLVPLLLDDDARLLPREGTQTGRLALFDVLAETYWGGFISGDHVTILWDGRCECGWGGPRINGEIKRFSEMEGGDDKITCAGTAKAYSDFMDYVGNA